MSAFPLIQDLVNALGWTLVHFLWQGLGIALLYWLVCHFTRPKSALLRYWAGMLAFLAVTVIPILTFSLYWDSGSGTEAVRSLSMPAMSVGGSLNVSVTQLLGAAMEPALPFVVFLWAIGVVILSARAFLGWVGAHRLVRLDTNEVSGSLQKIFQALLSSLEIRQAVKLLRSARVTVPTVVGWLKPVILLPIAVLNRLPEDQLEMIIAHELGHIRRYDYLLNLLQVVIETLFFYHPAIRWMSRQVRQEREHCCDDLVIAQCDQPVLYARALANLEIMRNDPVPVMVLAATGGDLIQRLHRIVKQDLPGHQSGFAQLAVMFGVAVLASFSARQGIEVSNHFIESSLADNTPAIYQQEYAVQSRLAWVEGISEFARIRLETERKTIAVRPELLKVEPAVEIVEIAINTGLSNLIHPNSLAIQDRQIFLPETPVSFSTATSEEDFTEELVSLLASNSLPSKTRFEADRHIGMAQDEMKVQFEISPETVVAPVYPFKARRQHINGFVRLEFSVDQSGRAKDIHVVDAQPAEVFEKSAINALEKWVFKVAQDHPENKRLYQIFDFDMESESQQLSKRERRCEIAGSRICGLKGYN